eukprot:s3154_g6.t1
MHEVLSVQDCSELLALAFDAPTEVLMAEYLKKKMSKELKHSNNPTSLQKKVDEGKLVEWQTLLSKPNAVRLHYGKAAENIRQQRADRFIRSRFVLTRKPIDEGLEIDPNDESTFSVKGRWCLQGHLDPDLNQKAEEGLLKSPTLSQLGRMTLMQVISSKQWQLQLGDIKGAFLEAGPLEERFRPLYAHQPPGGIPGVPPDPVIEVLGNVYGQNDAPAAWFKEFNSVVTSLGWSQSKLDACLYTLRDNGDLIGVMGVHVDDTALGGMGPKFKESIRLLRERFPYRKWRISEGEFCGAWYKQHDDFSISMNMKSFADKIRSINIPKNSPPEMPLNDNQIRVLRAFGDLCQLVIPVFLVDFSVIAMSSSKPYSSVSEELKAMLRRAKELGSLEEFTDLLLSDADDSEFECIPGGESMTDASKRRMIDPPERMERELTMSGKDDAKMLSESPASCGRKLPVGVANVHQWGMTVLATGKYQKAGFSYEELFSSSKKEHQSYCTWMLSQKHRVDLTAPVKDFIRYLMVVSEDAGESAACFEGSTVRRQLKTK